MAESEQMGQDKDPVSYWQVFYDDIMLMLFLSLAISAISYTIWGLMELGSIPVSPLITTLK